MLPYYMLNQNVTDDHMLHSPLHSSVGAIQVTSVPQSARDPVADRFIAACQDSGHAFVPDFNDGRQSRVGAGFYQFDIRHGKREKRRLLLWVTASWCARLSAWFAAETTWQSGTGQSGQRRSRST